LAILRTDLAARRDTLPCKGRVGEIVERSEDDRAGVGWLAVACAPPERVHPTPLAARKMRVDERPSPCRGG